MARDRKAHLMCTMLPLCSLATTASNWPNHPITGIRLNSPSFVHIIRFLVR